MAFSRAPTRETTSGVTAANDDCFDLFVHGA
jgi:hypothetical protein